MRRIGEGRGYDEVHQERRDKPARQPSFGVT